jgi:SulP family sulfate permease
VGHFFIKRVDSVQTMRFFSTVRSFKRVNFQTEIRCGFDSSVLGLSTIIGPILFFLGIFGPNSLQAAFWATLITATVVRGVRLLIGETPVLLSSSRAASTAAFVALVFQLTAAISTSSGTQTSFSAPELLAGLAAGSLMFAIASSLILLSGLLKLGNIFKMIPSTVTAGVANSTALLMGWLAIKQFIGTTWLTVLVALVMVVCYYSWPKLQMQVKVFRVVPAVLVAVLSGMGISLAAVHGAQVPASAVSYGLEWVSVARWPAVLTQADLAHLFLIGLPGTITLALVIILESFTAISMMETRAGVRTDGNRELVVLGSSNLLSAVLGGVPCTVAPAISLSNHLTGGRGMLAALSNLFFTGVLLVAIGPWLMVLPAGIVAGLYLIQAPMLVDPVFLKRMLSMLRTRQWRREGTADLGFWITFAITIIGSFGNLIWACFVGVGLSSLAVLRQVSTKLDAQWAYLDRFRSHRVRSQGELANLMRKAHRVGVLRLTGHVFFGNSRRLTQMIDELHPDCTALVIDVSQVHDVDTSGLDALQWLINALLDREKLVILTGLQRTPSQELRHAIGGIQGVEVRVDLDRGLELCEEQLLQNSTVVAFSPSAVKLEANALVKGLSKDAVTCVLRLGDRREVAKGDALFRRDTLADGVWLLEEGTVSILLGASDDTYSSRLATFGPGQFVGEMSLIDGRPRSATVLADSPVRALLFDRHAMQALEAIHPDAVLHMTRNIALELSHRVRSTSALMTEAHAEQASEWANSSLSAFSRF